MKIWKTGIIIKKQYMGREEDKNNTCKEKKIRFENSKAKKKIYVGIE